MKHYALHTFAAVGLLSASFAVQADDSSNDRWAHFILSAGLTEGGDHMVEVYPTTGGSAMGDVRAGGVFEVGAGILLQKKNLPVSAQLTYNYQVDSVSGIQGTATLTRWPIEALFFYNGLENWRFGVGERYLNHGLFTFTYNNQYFRDDFKSSWSPVVQAGYALSDNFWLDVRWVHEELVVANNYSFHPQGRRYNANHAGMFLSGYF